MTIEERAQAYRQRTNDLNSDAYISGKYFGYIQGATDQQKIDIKMAYDWLNKNLSRCVECYVDDVVTTRLKEDVLEDLKKAMEE